MEFEKKLLLSNETKVNQENEFALSCPWLFFQNE
jgi:hypothetical protein